MELLIRQAAPEDLSALTPLLDGYRVFYGADSNMEAAGVFLQERLEQADSTIFLAEIARKPAGFVQLFPSYSSVAMNRIFILNDLFVAPEFRGMSVGGALMGAAANFARLAGAIRLSLITAHDNTIAQSLYESKGWQQDSVFRTYNFALMD